MSKLILLLDALSGMPAFLGVTIYFLSVCDLLRMIFAIDILLP
jgi:hypothetical protein